MLGPRNMKNRGRTSLLPTTYAVIKTKKLSKTIGILQDGQLVRGCFLRLGRLLHDSGYQVIPDFKKLLVDFFIIAAVIISTKM